MSFHHEPDVSAFTLISLDFRRLPIPSMSDDFRRRPTVLPTPVNAEKKRGGGGGGGGGTESAVTVTVTFDCCLLVLLTIMNMCINALKSNLKTKQIQLR